ncbi:HD domain-containing protein [Apibacter muscae]|uniref:HD domain-containing protein n=1 Tax=Apibacter muscae TaxID=2509004 RepID=UPI001625DC96|nr:HD domain-containing protein [Apibacter muscae]
MNQGKNIKKKIFNDPVLGFITISDSLILKLIEHPYFQRLKRISQTGLTYYVYPGSTHTRFLHALGATHLMQLTLQVLKQKGVKISKDEERAASVAILLHDIGHGPFSHALESTLMDNIHHESLSITFMNLLNNEYNGELSLALEIFRDKYPRKFFHQLISSQIDLDRLDYLKRDSFFTGVSEGNINSERIITMMNVVHDELVIDEKGIYSIEQYLTSRLFMYWQVYFHKTSVTAEVYLIQALKRAKDLIKDCKKIPSTSTLSYFLNKSDFSQLNAEDIMYFSRLDDTDIITALKDWQFVDDEILKILSQSIIQRKLPFSRISSHPKSDEEIRKLKSKVEEKYNLKDGKYFVHQNKLNIFLYERKTQAIKLLLKTGEIVKLQDLGNPVFNNESNKNICRYHLCFPRDIL